ncbi:toll/interleukin-1 receptor domain-containing protein [Tahibacter sp.]|uniref:toll/interleukin-1 receptor domain-containing protein n=1 Tax=Tahibacter sp. TaxID=2056211 RepID=UPI0028C4FD68|nr:toll/interleukin-1 receptor domain-containing protein [Tahibacter sp.]
MPAAFDDPDWERLLDRIENRYVLPVIGPALVTAEVDGVAVPLLRHFAGPLAARLGLATDPPLPSILAVAREHLRNGGRRDDLYAALRTLLKALTTPSPGLAALARITDFEILISSTPDLLLAQALADAQPHLERRQQEFYFHPSGRSSPHPHPNSEKAKPNCDLPTEFSGALVYQVMGSLQSTDFAIWEEDYMEFVCGLIEQRGTLDRLFRRLQGSDLLLIGAPSEDWIVRFFLRAARGKRLSEDSHNSRYYLADRRGDLPEPMTFFFETETRLTRIIDGDPVHFALELAERWRRRQRPGDDVDFFARMPQRCPAGAVFLSYGREDRGAVERIGRELMRANVPVWLDTRELQFGDDFDRALESQIKQNCSFFVAIVSAATEDTANAGRYLHKERHWAASRQVDGYVFYLQIFVDLPLGHVARQEPGNILTVQRAALADAPAFADRLRLFVEENRKSGRPRA